MASNLLGLRSFLEGPAAIHLLVTPNSLVIRKTPPTEGSEWSTIFQFTRRSHVNSTDSGNNFLLLEDERIYSGDNRLLTTHSYDFTTFDLTKG